MNATRKRNKGEREGERGRERKREQEREREIGRERERDEEVPCTSVCLSTVSSDRKNAPPPPRAATPSRRPESMTSPLRGAHHCCQGGRRERAARVAPIPPLKALTERGCRRGHRRRKKREHDQRKRPRKCARSPFSYSRGSAGAGRDGAREEACGAPRTYVNSERGTRQRGAGRRISLKNAHFGGKKMIVCLS